VTERQQSVTREGEDSPAKGLCRCEADELQDDKGTDGEEEAATFAERVVEDLCNWLSHGRGGCALRTNTKNIGWLSHTVT